MSLIVWRFLTYHYRLTYKKKKLKIMACGCKGGGKKGGKGSGKKGK